MQGAARRPCLRVSGCVVAQRDSKYHNYVAANERLESNIIHL